MRQIVLDTETTGLEYLKGHRIIEIGCLEMVNRRLTGNRLHYYINPERNIEQGAQKIHGITEQFLQDKPIFSEIAAELIQFLQGAELIIHNAAFDVGFLNSELSRIGKLYKPITEYCSVTCTLVMARSKHPQRLNNLDALCRRYHVDSSNRTLHGALLDAALLAQVYLAMTGGQTQLFEEENENELSHVIAEKKVQLSHEREPLCIIEASSEEKAAHEELLKLIQKKGACRWQEFSSEDPL